MAEIKSWFFDQLPEPEAIQLSDYVEETGKIIGTFNFTNGKSITLCQKIEDIDKYINESEKEIFVDEALDIETVQINQGQMYG